VGKKEEGKQVVNDTQNHWEPQLPICEGERANNKPRTKKKKKKKKKKNDTTVV